MIWPKENLIEILKYAASGVGVIFILVYVIGLVRVFFFEKKLNKLHRGKQKEIDDVRSKPVTMQTIEGQTKRIIENYEPVISELERRRRFLLDKLPFFKK